MRKIIRQGEITVEGQPLKDYLDKEHLNRIAGEAGEELKKKIEEMKKCFQPNRIRYFPKEKQRKTVRWTDQKIRKEYGVMSKPFETHVENILHLVREKGPMTVVELAKELSTSPASIYSTISRINRKIPALFYRTEEDPSKWNLHGGTTPDEAYREYRPMLSKKTHPEKTKSSGWKIEFPKEEVTINVIVSGKVEVLFGFK